MKKPSSTSEDLPVAFLQQMKGMLGDEYESFLNALHLPANIGLRVNTLKLSPDEFTQRFPIKLSPLSWCPAGFIVESDIESSGFPSLGKHPYHNAGLYYLQESSAMAVAQVLAPQPGETVLDLAAAPGGKATHLAALMNNSGLLVANEIHAKRVWDLAENLERCGVTNAIVTNETPERLSRHFGAYFDRVLLDAPCSGEGMFRKSEVARSEWKPELVNSCALRQSAILEQAARMVKPGGSLAYTTCTFSAEENETVIARFLSVHPEFDLATIQPAMGIQSARPEWIDLPSMHKLNRAVRIWPHISQGEGHFIALLIKQGLSKSTMSVDVRNHPTKRNSSAKSTFPKTAWTILDDFCRANLDLSFDISRLILDGSYVFQLPEIAPDLAGLKVIRPGWWLGTTTKGRLIPSHSLALGITKGNSQRSLSLQNDDPQISAYLRGESLPSSGDDGWVLVTVDGFPIGWGKRVQNVVKNFYPHGLRHFK